jgi:hypothetical protein
MFTKFNYISGAVFVSRLKHFEQQRVSTGRRVVLHNDKQIAKINNRNNRKCCWQLLFSRLELSRFEKAKIMLFLGKPESCERMVAIHLRRRTPC